MSITTEYTFSDMGQLYVNGGSLPEVMGAVDINNDGIKEVFYGLTGPISSPISDYDPYPYLLSIEEDGSVTDIYKNIIKGTPPKLGWGNDMVAGDFNNDEFNDFLIIDHGREYINKSGWYPGGKNILFLSDGHGGLVDATENISQNNAFWHSAVNTHDIDEDGDLDIIVAALGGIETYDGGAGLFINDGQGYFVNEVKDRLPAFVSTHSFKGNDLGPGTAGFVDIYGDGIKDIVLLPYKNTDPDATDNSEAVFLKNDGYGYFKDVHQRIEVLNEADTSIPYTAGFSHFVIDDFNNDGLEDIIAIAEGPGRPDDAHLTFLYQNQNGNFIDETLSVLGSYHVEVPSYDEKVSTSTNLASMKLISFDVDLDGDKDLLWPVTNATSGSSINESLFINDGNGNFKRDSEFLEKWTSKLNFNVWGEMRPFFTDINSDGVLDLIIEESSWLSYPDITQSNIHVVIGKNMINKINKHEYQASFARDIINGTKQSVETVYFNGEFRDYKVLNQSDLVSVSRLNDKIDMDTLTDIERLRFSDTSVALDINGYNSAGAVYRLYQAAFDRTPDKPGLGYWIHEIDKGVSLQGMANSFIYSNEFQDMYGENQPDSDFLISIYENVLHRAPDEGGFNYWMNAIKNGLSKPDILSSFSESDENKTNVFDQIKNGFEYDIWIS